VQQAYRRPLVEELRKRAEKHYEKGIPEETQLWDLGWCTREVVVSYLVCEKCGEKRCHMEDNRGQGVISRRKLKEMKWCGCIGKAAWPREAKAQQSGTWPGEPESTAREGSSQKEVRRTFKMLKEVWLNIGVEKINTHEDVMIKALLDSGTMGMFMDRQTAARHGFCKGDWGTRLQENPQ